jgi:hypothetical protein
MDEILIPCIRCNADIALPISLEQYEHWRTNRRSLPLIQVHFAQLTADEREMLLTRLCSKCFAKACGL